MARQRTPRLRHAELVSASIVQPKPKAAEAKWTLKQVQGDGFSFWEALHMKRDMDLVRELMLQITDNNLQPHEEWSDKVIYHLKMLSDVGYIKGVAFMQAYQGWIAAPSNPSSRGPDTSSWIL